MPEPAGPGGHWPPNLFHLPASLQLGKADADPGITGTSKDWEGKSKNVQFQVEHPSKIEYN